jgi:hypothetical protein
MDNVVYFLIVEEKDKKNQIVELLKNSELKDKISVLVYDSFDSNNLEKKFTYIKVYSKKIEELAILKNYASESNLKIIGLTSSSYSNNLLKNSDYAMTLSNNKQSTKDLCHNIINSSNTDDLFKEVNKLYHRKNMKN